MIGLVFKYFFIILCSIYIFTKIQNISVNLRKGIATLAFSAIASAAAAFTRKNLSLYTLILIVILLTVFFFFVFKMPPNKTITFTAISLGISYTMCIIQSLIIGSLCYIIFSRFLSQADIDTLSYLIVGIFQFISTFLLFRIKRLNKGFADYKSKINNDLGVFTSLSLILIASLFNSEKNSDFAGTIILFCVLIIGTLLLFWWKRRITNIYLERVFKRNIEILENSLSEQQEINQKLRKSNEELSGIIHRDNKLIPAMESAVEEILTCKSADEQKEKSRAMLSQLKAMSSERSTILTDYENLHKTLMQTGIFSIDASLKYLMSRANKDNIALDLSVTCNIKEYIKDLISENDLNTLILDLGENALIAVRESEIRNVLVVFGVENEKFVISIFDSGLLFEQKVIDNFGKRRITTHKKTGGSGIGLMTTAELLRKHKASFVIDESIDSENYVKKVSVIFDDLSQCRITTLTNKIVRPL